MLDELNVLLLTPLQGNGNKVTCRVRTETEVMELLVRGWQ